MAVGWWLTEWQMREIAMARDEVGSRVRRTVATVLGVLGFLVLFASLGPAAIAQERSVLLVTNSPTGTADDQVVARVLEDAGLFVTIVDDDAVEDTGASIAEQSDAVLITGTALASKVGDSFASTAVPVVAYEFLVFDDMGLTLNGRTHRGEDGNFQSLEVADPSHPILDNAVSGEIQVAVSSTKFTWGNPAPSADVILTIDGEPDMAALFTYEPGDALANGDTAPGRRAGIFVSPGSDTRLNSLGQQILVDTMLWSINADADVGDPGDGDGDDPGDGGDPPIVNQAPVVDAGTDIELQSIGPIDVSLTGVVSDDGLPTGSSLVTTWSGPAGVTFDDASSENATATFPGIGTYELQLSATDGQLTDSDTVIVSVSTPSGTPQVLMVTASSTGTSDDRGIADLLTANGYAVTIVDDNDLDTSGASVADGFDVVMITTTVNASRVGSTFTDVAVPVVTYEHLLFDDLALTGAGSANRGEQGSYRSIDIVDPSHPIVGFNFSGEVDVYSSLTRVSYGVPGPGADIVALRRNHDERSVLFTYDAGAELIGGEPAPAPRAGLFLTAAGDSRLNEVGEQLLLNTVGWAVGSAPDAVNQAPSVSIEPIPSFTSGDPLSIPIVGVVSDDGLPDDTITTSWTGPATVSFDDPASPTTNVNVPGPGIYELTFTAADAELSNSATVVVQVIDPSGPPTVLMVTTNSIGSSDDQVIQSALEQAGFLVEIIDDNALTARAAEAVDGVLVTATASASAIGNTLTSIAVPVVNYEHQLHDDLGLTDAGAANRGEQGTFRAITIEETGHPITTGLSGATDVFERFLKVTFGRPATDADVLATQLNDPTRAVLFTYNEGDILANDEPAPAPRAGIFPAANSHGSLNDVGVQLLVNTVAWALEAANEAPRVEAGSDRTVDASQTVELNGAFLDDPLPLGSTPTVEWSGPAEVSFADPQALDTEVSFTQPGTYVLTLSVNDGLSIGSDTVEITAVAQQSPTASGTIDITSGTAPLTVMVDGSASSDSDGSISSYSWDFGDGNTASRESTTHTFTTAGSFDVTLTVVDNLGANDQTIVGTVEVEAPVNPNPDAGATGWIDLSRSYRVELTVDASDTDRIDRPAEFDIDFGALLVNLGEDAAFDPSSLRLVHIDDNGAVIDSIVPVQFSPASPGAENGTVFAQIVGTLPAGTTRTFHLYYDVVGSDPLLAPFEPLVDVDTNATDEGLATFAISTRTGTYQFDTNGGGFSSLDDVDGNDWINHSDAPRGLGEFRGFPNLIHPENQFHPGGTGVTTTLVEAGPLRVVFDVEVEGEGWSGRWEIFPTFARFELFAARHDYWFLYEGTPGGSFEPDTDIYVRSDGTSVSADTTVGTDIAGVEWSMMGDPNVGRSFFMTHDADDNFADSYFNFNDEMTVMSFGRESTGVEKLLDRTPAVFTVGLVDSVTAAGARGVIDSARLPLEGSTGEAEQLPLGDSNPVDFATISSNNGQLPTSPAGSLPDQTGLLVADLDGDGDDDAVVYGRGGDNSVQWFRRGSDGTYEIFVLESDDLSLEAGGAVGDVDGDGDIDLLLPGDRRENRIFWLENPGGGYRPNVDWVRHEAITSGPVRHHDIRFHDTDHDGQEELIFWTQGPANNRVWDLYVAEVPADPTVPGEWDHRLIYDGDEVAEGVGFGDIDGDGNDEFVAAGRLFTYDPAQDEYSSIEISDFGAGRYRIAQLIPGGRPEIVVSSGDLPGPLDLVEWNGVSWVTTSLIDGTTGIEGPWNRGHSLEIADFNGDGHLDIFSAEMYFPGFDDGAQEDARSIIWYGNGEGGFVTDLLETGEDNHESKIGDVDADGDIDVIAKPFNFETPNLRILLNQRSVSVAPSALGSWSKHVIDDEKPSRSLFVFANDIDGDGDDDIITGGWWYENPGAIDGDWTRNVIGAPIEDVLIVDDLDGDGNLDIFGTRGTVGTAPRQRQFAWARGDGTGSFTVFTNIESGVSSFIQGATTVQFSPTSPKEIWLSWNERSNLIQKIVIPDSPTTTQWTLETGSEISQGEEIEFSDLDGDGDLDLAIGHIWLENDGSNQSFERRDLHAPTACCFAGNTAEVPLPDRVVVADVNSDGRLDVVVSHEGAPDKGITWYEQPTNPTTLWTEHTIAIGSHPIHSVDVRDMDGDGDQDVVFGQHPLAAELIEEGQTYVAENLGGGTSWTLHLVDDSEEHHDGTQLADLDGDGDLDIFSIGFFHNRVIIYENTFGDGGGGITPPTPDTTPPVVSGVDVVESETTATVSWSTDERSTSVVEFGTTDQYGNESSSPALIFSHALELTGLTCETTYHFAITSVDAAGNTVTTSDATFETAPCGSDVLVHLTLDEVGGTVATNLGSGDSDGTLVNGASFVLKTGGDDSAYAVDLDGVNDAIDLGDVNPQGNALTVAAWIRPDSFPGNSRDGRIVSKASGTAEDDHIFMLSTFGVGDETRLRGRIGVGGQTTTVIADAGALDVDEWYHVAMTYDGTAIRLYVDGVEVGATPLSGPIEVDANVPTAAGNQPQGTRPFDGLIDNIQIVERALAQSEIATLAGN